VAIAAQLRRVGDLARKVVRGLFRHHAFDHAATMAFYFFLGLIPLLVIAGLLLARVVEEEGLSSVTEPLFRVLPGVTRDLIYDELTHIASAGAGAMAPLSVLVFLWLTSNGFHNLMDVFELLIGARPRPWLRQRLIAIVWVVAVLAASVACVWFLFVTGGWTSDLESAAGLPRLVARMQNLLAAGWDRTGVVVVFGAVTTVGVAAFYRWGVVHPRELRRRVWPGTLVAMGLWMLVSWAFGGYVATIGDYSLYYGSVATVAVMLLWFYLSSLALLIGAEVNAQLEGLREPPPTPAL
jgi:membrane protein